MGGLINTLEAEVFQWYLGLGSGAVATFGGATTSNFFGLTTAQPNEAGTSPAEYASGGNYARVQLTETTIWASAPSNSTLTNSVGVTFPQASANWGLMTHFIIDDASTVASNHRFYGSLTSSVNVYTGDIVKFKTGQITITSSGLFTHTAANQVLQQLATQAGTKLTTGYFALSTSTPTASGTNFTEPVGGSYARVTKTMSSVWGTLTEGDPTTTTTITDVTWTTATGGWGTVTHWGIFDSLTGGNLMLFGSLNASELITSGEQVKFGLGDCTLTID